MLQIASFFGVGFLPKAPGTWGSLFALPFAYLLCYLGFPVFVLATIIAFGLGWIATKKMQDLHGIEDPQWIVIDEVVGQWIALMPAAYVMSTRDLPFLWPAYVVGFIAFRFFDIKKPWLVGWADRRGDALGVMLDDVIAGVFAAIVVMVSAGLYHGFMTA